MSEQDQFAAVVFLSFIALTLLGVLPTIIAFRRRHPNRWVILVINVALGATLIGWLGALIWALHAFHKPDDPKLSAGGESGLNIFANDAWQARPLPAHSPIRDPQEPRLTLDVAVSELERLSRLRDGGHLTADEYGAMKAAVLKRV